MPIDYINDVDYANVNGIQIAYKTFGDEKNPSLLLVRGKGSQMIEWPMEMIKIITEAGFRVICFDNRDIGLSEKMNEDYAIDELVKDTIGLMDYLSVEKSHTFGMSMGSVIVQEMAYNYPDRVMSLMSVMSGLKDPTLPLPKKEIIELIFGANIDDMTKDEVIAFETNKRKIIGGSKYQLCFEDRLTLSTLAYERCFCPEGDKRQSKCINSYPNNVEKLKRIKTPTLVIHGDEDPVVPLEHGQAVAETIPNATLLIMKGMGHSITSSISKNMASVILEFIKSI